MSEKLEKFKEVLREVFQMDQADLDFGIYRIMNQKREEIEQFLDKDLLPQVKQLLEQNKSDDSRIVKDELDKALEHAQSIGVDPNTVAKVRELQERYSAQSDKTALENEVFSHLINFFKRYYDNGDFISQRRYKKDVYAIPYEGEEVKLYWANYDQYYIKTTEYFKNYSFKLNDNRKVNFVIIEATTEQNNNRSSSAKERRFYLVDENPIEISKNELNIKFMYDFNNEKQKTLNEDSFTKIKALLPTLRGEEINGTDFIGLFDLRPTPKNLNRTLLEKHINDYTARNTFDYFIHKDLGGFLRRELDFFIKNEVLYIDDINELDEKQFHKQIATIKVIKQVGHKVIAFLEQLENFQKKLWLKKKFVVETNYCITLDRVPQELYGEIITNQAQVDEWKKLFAIDEIQGDLEREAYSEQLTERFLEQNKFLVLDTAFFSETFKDRLLKSIDNIDEQTDGLLIHSENFQALNLLLKRYKEQAKCIYIDPPYNTNNDVFLYKDSYKHSSWMSLILDRVIFSKHLLNESNSFFMSSINKIEKFNLKLLLDSIFSDYEFINSIAVVNNPKGRSDQKHLPTAHEDLLFYCSSDAISFGWNPSDRVIRRYSKQDEDGSYREIDLRKTGDNDRRIDRPNMHYPFYYNESTGEFYPSKDRIETEGFIEILPMKARNVEGCWRWEHDSSRDKLSRLIPKFMPVKQQWTVFEKDYFTDSERVMPTSIWDEKPFNSERGTELFVNMGFNKDDFPRPKPVGFLKYLFEHTMNRDDLVVDYFGGSGSTAQAIIEANKENEFSRKYILVEMGEYFDSVMLKRVKKSVYSLSWEDSKPVSREGISQCFKYLRLESYEDTLNNLEVSRSQTQQQTLEMDEQFREGYMLSYMLDVETEGSASLLNIDKFEDPFNYYLNITRNNETVPTKIDLVETFNYLIGLVVETVDVMDGYKVITGKNLDDEKILVIWRNLSQKSNEDLNAFFGRMRIKTRDSEYDRIYVNGDNYLENMKLEEDKWKVVLIEEEFKKRMFENVDV